MGLIIKNIIPVTGNVITPEMVEYTRKYLQPDTELRTVQIKVGPPSIECEYDEAVAGPDVLRLCKEAEEEGCDGIFINCYGDPAVKAAREYVDIPVFGGFEPSLHLAMGLADKIAIISHGKIVYFGTLDDLRAGHGDQSLEELFLEVISHA